MLETVFQRGALLDWTLPPAYPTPNDGAIVYKSTPTPVMDFMGTTADIGFPALMGPTLTPVYMAQHGLTRNRRVNYRWLDYKPGQTARVRHGRRDILTGPMSGCPIARYQQGGTNYVAHVGTMDGMAAVNTLVKHTFRDAAPVGATVFNPAGAINAGTIANLILAAPDLLQVTPWVLAFVNNQGDFFTTVLLRLKGQTNTYYCTGQTAVPALQGPAFTALLT